MSNFIETVAMYVMKYARSYNIAVYSPIIAQAILESDSGKSELAINANNIFGLKYNPKSPDRCPTAIGYYVKVGSEQNLDGSYTQSAMLWQKFPDIERCVIGYFDFINVSRYDSLKNVTDPYQYIRLLKECGYATSLEYVEKVTNVLNSYNLTKYDPRGESKVMEINVHAGHNPDGKVGCGAVGYIKESTEARIVKDLVIKKLRSLGHTVNDTTCENGKSASDVLQKIVNSCNTKFADLDVSIHFNSYSDENAEGVEVLVYSTTSEATSYANNTVNAISKLGFKNRGVKIRNDLYYLKHTKSPAMLIECCFVSSKKDVERYNAEHMANAIVKGITGVDLENTSPKDEPTMYFRVQVGAFSKKENAEALMNDLKSKGYNAIIKFY